MKYSYLFDTDSYKVSQWLQYPENTTSMFSYIESRGGVFPETVFFGLQYYLKEYLTHRVTVEEVEKCKLLHDMHGEPFNYDGWMYIAKELGGRLPVRIRAVPEGRIIPTHNILVSIESTDPKVFWVVGWIETMLLRVWYPITVATLSNNIKKVIMEALEKSSDDPASEINFKLHDFGSRGVNTQEGAMIGGASHLVNFMGSDTVVGVLCANDYYNIPMAGFSIPASEHSTITSWGKENEVKAYRNMLKRFAKPGALVACVSDSYDLWNACEKLWGDALKQEIIDSGALLVIRPDSGDPVSVVLRTAEILESKFGVALNTKGFKVLKNVRIIQGDGINLESIKEILDTLLSNKYSITNVAFGMGGALLAQVHRDTQKFAMKCSHIFVNGESRKVFKDPITDPGKKSKSGRLDLVEWSNGMFQTVNIPDDKISNEFSIMRTVYENGKLLIDDNFETIRQRTKNQ